MLDRPYATARFAGLAFFLTLPSMATSATTIRVPVVPRAASNHGTFARTRNTVRRYATTPTSCSSGSAGSSGTYFVGVTSGNDIAYGFDSGILAGESNEACDDYSGVGAGVQNIVANSDLAVDSFIGGGSANFIAGENAFIGGGSINDASGTGSMIGSGVNNAAQASGSFVGAGDTIYEARQDNSRSAPSGNVASGTDSFVGSGDLNAVSGMGSFIGGGGTIYANGIAKPTVAGNIVSGQDSFVGAGDNLTISANEAFAGSGSGNAIFSGSTGAFIGAGESNTVGEPQSFIGGGNGNSIAQSGSLAFIGGGYLNTLYGQLAFIGGGGSNSIGSAATYGSVVGGYKNAVGAKYASIVGGNLNNATGQYSTVIGGYDSTASGAYAIVAGGNSNTAAGTLTYVAGYHADAVNNGSFVWSDYVSGSTLVKDTAANQFVSRASGGYFLYSNEGATTGVELAPGSGTWASLSDRNGKSNIVPLDGNSLLAKIDALPIDAWQYRSERGVRHAGPMAQDFYAAFGLGTDDRHITSIDEDGVALAAIKALHAQLARTQASDSVKSGEIGQLHRQMNELTRELHRLEARIK